MPRKPGELSRREALGALGAAAGVTALGGAAGTGAAEAVSVVRSGFWPSCVVTPRQTEGPYFVDEKLERTDIRIDPVDGSVCPGVPLALNLSVHRVDGAACTPLTGAWVDVWQCDVAGIYAGVADARGLFDTRAKKFLRGYQVTDPRGAVSFQTIYPGWYPGRTPHIHFKVRLFAGAQRTWEFTSQLYFDEAVTDRVYAAGPYASRGKPTTRNERDGIYRNEGGTQLMLRLAEAGAGWVGAFDIGLRMT